MADDPLVGPRPLMVSGSVVVAAAAAASASTSSLELLLLTRLAFGACSKQYMPQPLWEPIARFQPDAWVWAGDAIYKESGGRGGVGP